MERYLRVILATVAMMVAAQTVQAQQGNDLDAYLLFANRDYIRRVNLDGSNLVTLVNSDTMNAVAIDYDYRRGFMYWSDTGMEKVIMRAHLNGSNPTVIVSDVGVVDGLAWDWVNSKLYWTDNTKKTIEVLDPSTGRRKVLISTADVEDSRPRAIVVDPASGWLYWTDWSMTSPRIEKASMDGTQRSVLFSNNLSSPNGMTLDFDNEVLYWNDAGKDRLERSRADGSQRRNVTADGIRQPFGITYYNEKLYWPDRRLGSILTVPVNGSSSVSTVIDEPVISGFGIAVIASQRQAQKASPCGDTNGGCSFLCLLSSSTEKFSCVCEGGSDVESPCVPVPTPTTADIATTATSLVTTAEPSVSPSPAAAPCGPDTCENGGTCDTNEENEAVCTCPKDFVGTFCEVDVNEIKGEGGMTVPASVFVSVTGGLILVIILVLLLALCVAGVLTKRRKDHASLPVNMSQSLSELVNERGDSRAASDPEYCSIKSNSPAPKVPLHVYRHMHMNNMTQNHYCETPRGSIINSGVHGLNASSSDDLVSASSSFKTKVRTM